MTDRQTYYPNNSAYGINLLFSGKEICQPGHTFGPAKRTNYLLHYILEGKGSYDVDANHYSLEKGQAFLIYPDEITLYKADVLEPWTYLWLGFDGGDCEQLLDHLGFSKEMPITTSPNQAVTRASLEAIVSSASTDLANPLKRLAAITDVFSSLVSNDLPRSIPKSNPIDGALNFIHHNYQDPIRISHLAETFNMERSWLYRLFMEETGLSPKDYLTGYRLKIAKNYLQSSSLSLTEVALSCGFTTSSTFHKQFKKAFGITPKAFRSSK